MLDIWNLAAVMTSPFIFTSYKLTGAAPQSILKKVGFTAIVGPISVLCSMRGGFV